MSKFPEFPSLLNGGISVDDRGKVLYNNEIDLQDWKRFYVVENHEVGFIRAWHGHKFERKLVIPLSGAIKIACIKIDNWEKPSCDLLPEGFILSSELPRALFIPNGYANGFKTLTNDAQVLFLSSATLGESLDDDWRFAWDQWDVWKRDYR